MFVERLCALMKEQGVTRSKLLTDLKMGKNQFKVWEKGGQPTVATISAIANYLDTTVEYLTGETDENNKNAITVDTPISADMSTKISPIAHAFSSQEQMLIDAYRAVSDEGKMRMIQAVLNIKDQYSESVPVYRVARSTDDRPPKVEMLSKSDLDKLKNAPKVTSDDDL